MAAPTTHHHADLDRIPLSTTGTSIDPFTLFPGDNDTTTGLTYLDWSGGHDTTPHHGPTPVSAAGIPVRCLR